MIVGMEQAYSYFQLLQEKWCNAPWVMPNAKADRTQPGGAVVGGGGITCAEDAIEFFIAGATAVQVGIYNFVDPQIMVKIIEGVEKYLIEHRMKNIGDLRGSLSLS